MSGQRVLVSGMGGELGSRVATMLENEPWVGELMGIDNDPPRRRLRHAAFNLIQPSDRARIVDLVTGFNPHVLIHIAVWEPHSRANPARAEQLTSEAATSIISAAAECRALQNIVVRSGVEVYGRAHGAPTRPDESVVPDPTCAFGRTLLGIERTAGEVARRVGASVGAVRLAPVLGPHVPSPLGRLLRQPAVPFSVVADPPFAVLVDNDASRAFVAAARQRLDQPVNVVADGAITSLQAILRGRRLPVPLLGPAWYAARQLSKFTGAPIPEHVHEMMSRGRLADNGRMKDLLGIVPEVTTYEAIDALYAWPTIIRITKPAAGAAA
jgi:UDP-glucose 4-epimerase